MPRVAVLVPGILGSELVHQGQVIWPGTITEYLYRYSHLEKLLSAETTPGKIILDYGIIPQYSSLVSDLERCGFSLNTSPPTLYTFPYDWRKSNIETAGLLGNTLDEIVTAHGADCEIVLVAHSMGGLVCRCFLQTPANQTSPAWNAVKLLITIGTPHQGAPLALSMILGQEAQVFLAPDQVRDLAKDDRYPSAYELLPPATAPFLWNAASGQNLAWLKLSDESLAHLNLNAKSLASAAALHAILAGPLPAHVRCFCFAGTSLGTITHLRYQALATPPIETSQLSNAGDGTVPFWSSLISGVQVLPIPGKHATLFNCAAFRFHLGEILGVDGLLAVDDVPSLVRLVVRDEVVAPGAWLRIAILCSPPQLDLDGMLQICPLDVSVSPPTPQSCVATAVVKYQGAAIETLEINLRAPDVPGFYRLTLGPAAGPALASDDFIVQSETTLIGAAP